MFQHVDALVGEAGRCAAPPLEQGMTEMTLERRDMVAHGGLGNAELVGGEREAARSGRGHERTELPESEIPFAHIFRRFPT